MALPAEPQTAISLFSGAGGLDLGIKLSVPSCRTVCYVEREAYAAALLVARMEEAALDLAPVWDDVGTFDGSLWCGRVDLVAGGSPCTQLSLAGNGQLLDGDDSALFFEFVRVVREVRPRFLFWENVRGALRVLPLVLRIFEGLGYRGRFAVVRAGDTGTPHERARVFVLAHADGAGLALRQGFDSHPDERQGPSAERVRRIGVGEAELRERPRLRLRSLLERHRGTPACAPLSPPEPLDEAGWRDVALCRPDLVPVVRRMAHGLADRVDRLRLLGNGVAPLQAAHAWAELWAQLD